MCCCSPFHCKCVSVHLCIYWARAPPLHYRWWAQQEDERDGRPSQGHQPLPTPETRLHWPHPTLHCEGHPKESSHRDAAPNLMWEDMSIMSVFELHNLRTHAIIRCVWVCGCGCGCVYCKVNVWVCGLQVNVFSSQQRRLVTYHRNMHAGRKIFGMSQLW